MGTKTCEEKEHTNEDRGSSPKERYPLPLMSKGEREKYWWWEMVIGSAW